MTRRVEIYESEEEKYNFRVDFVEVIESGEEAEVVCKKVTYFDHLGASFRLAVINWVEEGVL